jgi:hypothetical protein
MSQTGYEECEVGVAVSVSGLEDRSNKIIEIWLCNITAAIKGSEFVCQSIELSAPRDELRILATVQECGSHDCKSSLISLVKISVYHFSNIIKVKEASL